jgi:restriction endonuclease S subunit
MESININVNSEQKAFLDSLANYSDWIRSAIDDKRGKSEQSLQEIQVDLDNSLAVVDKIQKKYVSKLEQIEQHKADLKLSELEAIEQLKAKKEKKRQDFVDRWSPILYAYQEIKEFQYIEGWETVANLSPIFEMLRKNNVRIGIYELREFLSYVKPKEQPIQESGLC